MVPEGLPLRIAYGHAVLVLEEPRALGLCMVDAVSRAAPLEAHLAHGVLDERRLRQGVAVAHGEQRSLDRLVHEAPRPHLPCAQLLEHVEPAHQGVGASLPAAPGAVVLVEVTAPALLERIVARAGPRELVDEVGHAPSLTGRLPAGSGLTAALGQPRLRSAARSGPTPFRTPPDQEGTIDERDGLWTNTTGHAQGGRRCHLRGLCRGRREGAGAGDQDRYDRHRGRRLRSEDRKLRHAGLRGAGGPGPPG